VSSRIRLSALLAIVVAGAVAQAAEAKSVTVMTRNLYLGADITRPLVATNGATDLVDGLRRFGNANAELRRIVDQTDFPARAKLLAREIATARPDLIGLQEVALFRRGKLEPLNIGAVNAKTVELDFLKILRKALVKRGVPYVVVRKQQESDVEGPAFDGADPFTAKGKDVRLTLNDVMLRRKTSKVKILKARSRQYDTRLDVTLGGKTFSFIRGAIWADAKLGQQRFRFITTHLESQGSAIRTAQAQELMEGPAAVKGRPVILVCDCNSDPNETGEDANQSAYQVLTGVAPYAIPGGASLFDAFTTAHPDDVGLTSGFGELVNDPDTSGFTHRIDLVLGRSAVGTALTVQRAVITGLERRTPAGLWASDHAGLVARLAF
jgi:endonuclease/exonuclease/phosphatase family metal-dependent hydrolase